MTLEKIAKLANVSISTASKALKNSFDVSEETRKKVIEVAKECGYFAEKKKVSSGNKRAQNLSIAVMCPEVISPYYSNIVETLSVLANELGHGLVVYNVGLGADGSARAIADCLENPKIDAVISLSTGIESLKSSNIPYIVTAEEPVEGKSVITLETEKGIELFKEISGNWKDIVFATEKQTNCRSELFMSVFSDARQIVGEGRFEDAGVAVARQIIESGNIPDAVICGYDEIAYGLIDTFRKNGIRVPEDVEVAGINNIRTSNWFSGGLTALSFEYGDVFRKIFEDIAEDIKTRHPQNRVYKVEHKLIKRNTTK